MPHFFNCRTLETEPDVIDHIAKINELNTRLDAQKANFLFEPVSCDNNLIFDIGICRNVSYVIVLFLKKFVFFECELLSSIR